MDIKQTDRRTFLKSSLTTAAIAASPLVLTARKGETHDAQTPAAQPAEVSLAPGVFAFPGSRRLL